MSGGGGSNLANVVRLLDTQSTPDCSVIEMEGQLSCNIAEYIWQ